MKLVGVVQVHGGQHTEHIGLYYSDGHLQNTHRDQSCGAEDPTDSSTCSSASQHLGTEIRDDMQDHVARSQVSSKTNSKGDSPREE